VQPQHEGENDKSLSKRKQLTNREVRPQQEGIRWDGVSRLKGNTPSADLRKVADNDSFAREKRAEAIFSLFVNHLKLSQGAAKVGETLKAEKWLNDSSLERLSVLIGWLPVKMTFEDTVFCLRLFPDKKGWSDWVIYFRLSGRRTAEEARAFLLGAKDLKKSPNLVEFALCFPAEGNKVVGRIERFAEKGVAVIEW